MPAWSLPQELNQPLPRKFMLSASYKASIYVITITFLAPALFIIPFIFLISHRTADLKTRGVPTFHRRFGAQRDHPDLRSIA
jgi:hypothetical protein